MDRTGKQHQLHNLHRRYGRRLIIGSRQIVRLAERVNPGLVFAFVSLVGWFLSSITMAQQMHPLPGSGAYFFDLSHPWYIPVAVGAAFALAWRRLAAFAHRAVWAAPPPEFDRVSTGLRPEVRDVAVQLVRSPALAPVLAYFRAHPGTSLTAADLAGCIQSSPGDVEPALSDLVFLGFVQERQLCDLTFYRLTTDRLRRAQLDELAAWQERWMRQSQLLAEVVGPNLAFKQNEAGNSSNTIRHANNPGTSSKYHQGYRPR